MSDIQFMTLQPDTCVACVSAVVLLFVLTLLSVVKIAFFSLGNHPLDASATTQYPNAQAAHKILENPQRLLATILILTTLVSVSCVLMMAYIGSNFVYVSSAPFSVFLLQATVVVVLLLFFAEILPKLLATTTVLKVSLLVAPTLLFFGSILSPFVRILLYTDGLFNPKLSFRDQQTITKETLSQALERRSTRSDEDIEMLEGIIRFGNKRVVEIMTSRVDMVDFDITLNFQQLLARLLKAGYSRIPVYADSHDTIKGVLYAKDLLPHLDKPANFRWQSLIRPAFYVPETKMIDDLLIDFQRNKVHLAIVVDEFGGTSGLVTLEDILEEIVGDISDEYDEEEKLFTKINNHTYLFEAKIQLNDFFKMDAIDEDVFREIVGEVETLAGLILEIKGEMPVKGEQFEYAQYVFEIVAVDNRRIQKVKLYIKNNTENE